MTFQIISSDYFSSNWYQYMMLPNYKTEKTNEEEYRVPGTFSQETNWEKIFTIGDRINRDLKITEQQVLDDITSFRKAKKQ